MPHNFFGHLFFLIYPHYKKIVTRNKKKEKKMVIAFSASSLSWQCAMVSSSWEDSENVCPAAFLEPSLSELVEVSLPSLSFDGSWRLVSSCLLEGPSFLSLSCPLKVPLVMVSQRGPHELFLLGHVKNFEELEACFAHPLAKVDRPKLLEACQQDSQPCPFHYLYLHY